MDYLNYLLCDAGEDSGMFGSELGEDFAVELKAVFLEFRNEGAV